MVWNDDRCEELVAAENERGVLEDMIRAIAGSGQGPAAPLDLARAQTLCACGSFESAAIGEIPDEFRRIDAESGRVEVEGMTDLVLGAYESASLFSELNIGWAKQGEKINLEGYDYFPAFRTDLILFEKAG